MCKTVHDYSKTRQDMCKTGHDYRKTGQDLFKHNMITVQQDKICVK